MRGNESMTAWDVVMTPPATFMQWVEHCRLVHPSPIWAEMGESVDPADDLVFCPVCARLAPAPQVVAWHHTSPVAARQIVTQGRFNSSWDGVVFFTSWPSDELGIPGSMPAERGAVVEALLPAEYLRADILLTQRRVPELHLRCHQDVISVQGAREYAATRPRSHDGSFGSGQTVSEIRA